MGVTLSIRKWFEPVMIRARQISLQRPIATALAVFASEADARLAVVTYARQTRRPSPDTWPLTIDNCGTKVGSDPLIPPCSRNRDQLSRSCGKVRAGRAGL
jgi:hypothetical protein